VTPLSLTQTVTFVRWQTLPTQPADNGEKKPEAPVESIHTEDRGAWTEILAGNDEIMGLRRAMRKAQDAPALNSAPNTQRSSAEP